MKKIVPEFQFSPREAAKAEALGKKFGLSALMSQLLFSRGVDSEEKMRIFLHPSQKNFLSPFLMKGMKEAKEMLTRARDEEWRVAIFGDYDADGIGAVTILSRALKEFGIEPYLYIPERSEGYGMSIPAIDKIFDEFLPDLIITVDCGISCADVVEYIKEQGAYVIVTDHHELPPRLPDCIIINPKLEDDYPYDNLAGAGVAFKLSVALIGEEAYKLLDVCALSTVADSVPLMGENRDIVAEGLKLLESSPRPAFSAMLGKNAEISAQTFSFTVAPRVNAAGRMGDVASALRLFTSDDEEEIYALAEKLSEYNTVRQRFCDELFREASAAVRKKPLGRVAMVASESWNGNFVGIVAARIAEEFSRPALLFVRKGDFYRGSARSIESINIFEALTACSHLIEEFGGHSQAAGITVAAENFEALEEALNVYLGEHYDESAFAPTIPVAGELDGDFLKTAQELAMLEPFGVGNKRPLFTYRAKKMKTSALKADSVHLVAADEHADFIFFNGMKYRDVLESKAEKTIVFECNLNKYRGKESARGTLKNIIYDCREADVNDEILANNFTALARHGVFRGEACYLKEYELRERVKTLLKEAKSAVFIASSLSTLKAFPEITLPAELYRPSGGGTSALIVSPAEDCELSGFQNVVFLDKPLSFPSVGGAVYVNSERDAENVFRGLECSREVLSEVFLAMRNSSHAVCGRTLTDAYEACGGLGFSKEKFFFALSVFSELGFLTLTENGLLFHRGVKRELQESAIFNAVAGAAGA